MKIQIKRFSTHQTAKVFALLMAASSLVILLPFIIISFLAPTPAAPNGSEIPMGIFSGMFILMPVFQGIMGYIMVRIGLWIYNLLSPKIGGIEFEYESID
ncbi:hypothetical protein [Dasania marina]|uniref:hypothetical protein n=1 Tax=Dasania marina TaxID=471499 RepID=UPI0012EA89A2|nr:hypothetical protein [Dasania marina]